jgi:predicted ATP-dependent serine protease
MLPWETPAQVAPVDFVCRHCEQVQEQVNGQVILCMCRGAVQERSEEKQRVENWRRQQEEARTANRRRR